MSWQERKRKAEERAKKLHEMRAVLDKAQEEKRSLNDDENKKFDALHDEAEGLAKEIQRLDQMDEAEKRSQDIDGRDEPTREQRAGREDVEHAGQGAGSAGEDEQRRQREELEKRAWTKYLERGYGELDADERRAVTTSDQGTVGPQAFGRNVIDALKHFAGVIEAGADVRTTATGNDLPLPTGDDTANTGRLVGEGVENSNDTDPTMGIKTLSAYRFDSDWIKLSEELLQDAGYDAEAYIRAKAAERIGRALNTYSTTGTGSGQPHGVMVGATVGKTAASTSAITYEELLDLIHSVDAAYRRDPSCRIMVSDLTLKAIRKLKDGDNRYLFQPGTAGEPNTILGYGYVVNNDVAELSDGASSLVAAFGAFNRMVVRHVTGMTVIRAVEKFAEFGLVGFLVRSRHDSRLTDSAAIKSLQLAAS